VELTVDCRHQVGRPRAGVDGLATELLSNPLLSRTYAIELYEATSSAVSTAKVTGS